MNACVVTTINKPTKAIEELYKRFGDKPIIVGDTKTPSDWQYKGTRPIFDIKLYAPDNHYSKKNLGYLEAIRNKAEFIYDTDDDNIPNQNWNIRNVNCNTEILVGEGWYNIYKLFLGNNIWARGFPLNKIYDDFDGRFEAKNINSSIQQGMIDADPDVDAIWRLTVGKPIKFYNRSSITLSFNGWHPFNSQSTWFFPKAFPLLYLPVHATFRMTDIWRSFVAQRCLWELGEGITFHSPAEVYQDRNEHDLMKDFEQEIPGYLHNEKIATILSGLKLKEGEENVCNNMLTCYEALVEKNILSHMEIFSLKAWIKDYDTARNLE